MAVSTSNVNTITDSFQNWIDKTNILLDAYSTTIVTSASNTAGGLTTGNVNVEGVFRANTVAVSTLLRGGNVTTAGVLLVAGNVSFGNSSVNTTINSTTLKTDLNFSVSGTANLLSSLGVSGTTTLAGNATLSGALQSFSGNSNFDSGVLFVDSVNNRVGVNDTSPSVALQVNGDLETSANATIGNGLKVTGSANLASSVNMTGPVIVTGTTTLQGNTTLQGAVQTISGNVNIDSGVLFVDSVNNRVGINNTTPGSALVVGGNVSVTSSISVQGNASVSGNLSIVGALTTTGNQVNVIGNTTISKDVLVQGNTFLTGNTLVITTSGISVNAVATFTANTTLQANVTIQGPQLLVNTAAFVVASNNDLGANITSQLVVLSIPKAAYKGGEIIISARKPNQSQTTKMLFTHDETNVELTTYGTVTSPSASPELVTLIANINNSNIEFSVQQSSTSTAVKLMATLF